MKHEITITINGEQVPLDVVPSDLLLDALRFAVGVKSPKIGCERGDCGSCTVVLDGKTVRSCLILAVETDGRTVLTVEGLSGDGPTALQDALIAKSSFQCGFCAPGIVLAAAELLEQQPRPTREEVMEAISGNLCRCTGYEPIIDAVLASASDTWGGEG